MGTAPSWPRWFPNAGSVAQRCLTLCDPMGCSPPGLSVHGVLQARMLEWVALASSGGSSWSRDWTHISCIARGFSTTGPLGKSLLILITSWKHRRQHYHRGVGLQHVSFKGTRCPVRNCIYLSSTNLSITCTYGAVSEPFCQSREQFQIFIHNKEELCEHACIL